MKVTLGRGVLAAALVWSLSACASTESDDDVEVFDARDEGALEIEETGDTVEVPEDAGEVTGPPPSLTGVAPLTGPTAGGTPVTLAGENFAPGVTASFGGAACTDLFYSSARRLTCRTPAHAAGAVTVVVSNPDGQSGSRDAAFTYDDGAAPVVGECRLRLPAEMSAEPDTAAGPVYGDVFVEGVTRGVGAGAGVQGQLGVAAAGATPSWTWAAAAYAADVDGATPDDRAYDEYQASVPGQAAGEYLYAFRFSVDGGTSWTECDTNGSGDGFDVAHAGRLHVSAAPPPVVGWCGLNRPLSLTAVADEAAEEPIFGRVFVESITEGDGQGAGVTGQVGVGPRDRPPTDAAWTWTAAAYAASVDGVGAGDRAHDEYSATVTAPATPGEYAYAVRFSTDGGSSWTVCDRAGPGYSAADAGALTVLDPAAGPPVDWCNLQWPSSVRVAAGGTTELIFGRVYVAAVTVGAGRGAGVTGQLGYGAAAADPSTWTWAEASYNLDVDGLLAGDRANDEYMRTLAAPARGTYAYAYRFSRDGGVSWKLCDLDGSDNGFAIAQAGTLTVE